MRTHQWHTISHLSFFYINRRTTVVGKFVFVFVSENFGFKSPNHIYFADLERNGEIKGKITLTPIYNTDFTSTFDVSRTENKTTANRFHFPTFQLVTMADLKAIYRTNREASNYQLIAVNLENPNEENWTTLIEVYRISISFRFSQSSL